MVGRNLVPAVRQVKRPENEDASQVYGREAEADKACGAHRMGADGEIGHSATH